MQICRFELCNVEFNGQVIHGFLGEFITRIHYLLLVLKTITGDKKPAGQKADTFDPAAYQRAKRLAKQSIPGGKPARFDPQIPVS